MREILDIKPIVEFMEIEWTQSKGLANWEIFTENNGDYGIDKYKNGIKIRLKKEKGIYVFYDSRGKAIYVGKTENQTLWKEIKNAYNRNRDDHQKIRLVKHPVNNIDYNESPRKIQEMSFQIHEVAFFFSAYSVSPETEINKIEALMIRSFANDLLNKKMETL